MTCPGSCSCSCSCRCSCPGTGSSSRSSARPSPSFSPGRPSCVLWAVNIWARESTGPPSSSCSGLPPGGGVCGGVRGGHFWRRWPYSLPWIWLPLRNGGIPPHLWGRAPGDHECPRGNKSGNRYEVLAGSEEAMDMDVELGSLSSFLDGLAVDNLMEAMKLKRRT
ncbi:hypothetical protein AAFF_G00090910 [Aldrovandia affinis]|uniref:Uncharacterized protein n=1 Tax=Aldrovandia affinis TaxID=143900 RepID=A0AAD7WCV9_9TELE|nr:hypothetical protein AAFF_G00090910 [Aldrovandia affinis]